ncbi:hypothetical protein EV216_13616 [Rhodovulum steppense]|uniref:Uncharacterized protein n=1 Tax=Rhodovulum steppense TaxID=540251 RepID=A0A4R1YHY1_9RHOB|nr:hypothetical protein EV216_13616 [Rhodovulum steppense]
MKHDPLDSTSGTPVADGKHRWSEFLAWAETSGEAYATLCEIRKVPARLGMIDADAGLIPADLGYFERTIAPSSFAAVSKSKDLSVARDRSNARVRSALKRFLMVREPARQVTGRAAWDRLIGHVADNASPPGKGGTWNVGALRALETLRARSPVPPQGLVQAVADRMMKEAGAGKRRSIGAGLRFLNDLVARRDAHPDIAQFLPVAQVSIPAGSSRAAPIAWDSLPAAFRDSCETVFRRAIANPADMVAEARARIAAGEDPLAVHRELEKRNRKRGKGPGNDEVAREQYRRAVTWLVRAAEARGTPRVTLGAITDVMTFDIIDAAAQDQIARSRSADDLKDPETSQTLHNRLLPLRIIARHGLRSKKLVKAIKLVQKLHKPCIVEPGRDSLVEEIDEYCRQLQRTPSMATALVNAPATIARKAEAELETARAAGHAGRELSALRLYMAAVMFAIQMSRPMRTSNLIRVRHRSCGTAKGNLTWIAKGEHAELRFPPGEIKNKATVTVHVVDEDGDAEQPWFAAGGGLARHQAQPCGEVAALAEGCRVSDRGHESGRVQCPDAGNAGQPPGPVVAARHGGELGVERCNPAVQLVPPGAHVAEQEGHARAARGMNSSWASAMIRCPSRQAESRVTVGRRLHKF